MKTKNFYRKTAIFLILCSFFSVSNAQILSKLKKKIEQKVEQKIEQKIENKTDEILDETLDGNKELNPEKKITSEKKFVSGLPSKIEFSSSIDVEFTSENDKAKLRYHFGKNLSFYGMTAIEEEEEEPSQSITIFEKNAITLFMNTPGFNMKKSVPQEQFSMNNYASNIPDKGEIKKTGLTKNILGYTCYQYYYSNEKGSVTAWASTDFPIQNTSVAMLGMKEESPIEGFVLELQIISGNEKATVKTTNVNSNNPLIINTQQYKNF